MGVQKTFEDGFRGRETYTSVKTFFPQVTRQVYNPFQDVWNQSLFFQRLTKGGFIRTYSPVLRQPEFYLLGQLRQPEFKLWLPEFKTVLEYKTNVLNSDSLYIVNVFHRVL